jgi:hypothetical protein
VQKGVFLGRPESRRFDELGEIRKTAFETIDKPALKPLPAIQYQFAR